MESKLNAVLLAWKSFNIYESQTEFDDAAATIALNQDESEASRKKLVDQLKEFKSVSTEEARTQASQIIRRFQNEVDRLNQRSKYAESAFLKSYQKFLDIIDPVPILEYCANAQKKLEKLDDLQIECNTLRSTMNEYKEEFKDIKNQEITIKNLKDKLKRYEEETEMMIQQRVSETERKLKEAYEEKRKLLIDDQERAIKKLEEAEGKQKTLEQSLEQTQSELFDSKLKQDDSVMAKTEAMEILMTDLERANQMNAILQKELSELHESSKKEFSTLSVESSSRSQIEVITLESEIKAKNREIEQLIGDMNRLQTKLDTTLAEGSAKVQTLEQRILEMEKHKLNLEQKLHARQDYEEIKTELSIMKSVEFSSLGSSECLESSEVKEKPLQVLLLEKNKTLQNENTTLRVRSNALHENINILENYVKELKEENDKKTELIVQLESDVSRIQNNGHSQTTDETTQLSLLSAAVQDIGSTLVDNNVTPTNSGPSDALLSIVAAQRERFRAKNDELESELMLKNNQMMNVQAEVNSLRSDNLKLYEKIKFLQSYDNKKLNADPLTESRYSSEYERTLDPFSSFSQKEKNRKYASLSPFEKMTLFFGKFILQSKAARTAAFLYLVFVHCLIFFVLFVMAHTESCKRESSSNCAQKFMEHMQDVHGNNEFVVT